MNKQPGKTEQQYTDFFNALGNRIDIDFNYYLDFDDHQNFEAIYDVLSDNSAFDVEVIYYHNAMEYLLENDPSLQESLEIASDMGYGTNDINSELLASLLQSQELRQEFSEAETEIEDFLNELFNN